MPAIFFLIEILRKPEPFSWYEGCFEGACMVVSVEGLISMNKPGDLGISATVGGPGRGMVQERTFPALSPVLCLLGAVVLLSSVTPIIKYVFQYSALHPIGMAGFRVTIGFSFLLLSTLICDRGTVGGGATGVGAADMAKLTLLGLLGVASYAVAAWGLLYTSVTHYILIYSLM